MILEEYHDIAMHMINKTEIRPIEKYSIAFCLLMNILYNDTITWYVEQEDARTDLEIDGVYSIQ